MNSIRLFPDVRNGLVSVIFLWLIFSSCASNEQKPPDVSTTPSSQQTGSFRVNCAILDSSEIAKWVDSGYTKPGTASAMKLILLQNYSPDAARADTNNSLLAYAATTMSRVMGGPVRLRVSPRCEAQSIAGEIAVTNNYVRIADLPIFNPDGTLKPFKYIEFIPVIYPQSKTYLAYNYRIISFESGQEKVIYSSSDRGRTTDPCPPYCNGLDQ